MITRFGVAVLTAVALAACGLGTGVGAQPSGAPSATASPGPAGSSRPSPGGELTVFAAASLGRALDPVATAYEAANPGTTLTVSTDSSSALATQIEQGAPADVFLSADAANPQRLVDGGFAVGGTVAFAGNELAIITPTDNPGGLVDPFGLASDGVRVVAAGDEVPITRYAAQLVENLAAAPGAPAGFAAAYAANVVSREDNVGAVRAKVELGEGDAAIVYRTDAAGSGEVAVIDVPDEVNVPATYAGVVVAASERADAARAFLDWLAGPDGQAILAGFGFLPPSP